MQSVSHDAFEVARIITPLLVGLKLSGKLVIDLDPWIFAGIALLVERMGVAAFCAGYEADEDETPEQDAPVLPRHEKVKKAPEPRRGRSARQHGRHR